MLDDSQEPARGFVRARPVRVAFLVIDNEHAQSVINSIFAESISRWGGRYSLICPCVGGYPTPNYQRWLRSFDADIIYSFVELAGENVRRLREEFGPAYITRHRTPAELPKPHDFRVELPIKALTSLSSTLEYARAFPTSSPKPVWVIDCLPGQASDRFIDDNFGTFSASCGIWPIPPNLTDVIRPLSIASSQAIAGFYGGRSPENETVPDASALLHFMAANRNTYGLSQLSADSTPRIDVRTNDSAFTLVVGESFEDRIAFWNLRSRDVVHLGREICGLIVSASRLDNADFFAALVVFLKSRNEVWRNAGPKVVRLVSMSVPREQLKGLQERFIAADKWNVYQVGPAITVDSIAPSEEVLRHAKNLVTGRFFDGKPEWKEFPASGRKASPPSVTPKHISHVPSSSYATGGAWALDISIERQENNARYANVRHRWFFPRRLRLHRAFLGSYDSTDGGRETRYTRGNANGSLVLFASLNEELPVLTIPNDETAFRYGLQRGDVWPSLHRLEPGEAPRGSFAWSEPSDKGRYLLGTLRMFGSLQEAASVLLHSYWRGVFQELGGAIGPSRRDQLRDSIKKKIRTVSTQPSAWDDATWERLTSLVASEAHQVRVPQTSLSYDDLQRRHGPFLSKEQALLEKDGADGLEGWIERSKQSLKYALQDRCIRGVLFQGHEWRCETCFSKNWNDISALKPELTCSICGSKERAPVAEPWSFRLNGFLQDALREHGLLALVWCLVELERQARETFFYLGPHNLWKDYPDNKGMPPSHEADLICVVDGLVHLCEVKSSGRDIAISSLVEVAKRLRPDIVTLAVMEEETPRLLAKVKDLETAIADPSIRVELLTLRLDERWEDAGLP
jgi:hypothetical protein